MRSGSFLGVVLGTLTGTNIFASFVTSEMTYALELTLATVLIISGAYGLIKSDISKFTIKDFYFFPVSFITSVLSSVIGAGSPIINVLFQRTRLTPFEIVGTKSFSNFILQFSKLVLYIVLLDIYDLMSDTTDPSLTKLLTLTAFATLGALAGSFVSKKYLDTLDIRKFDKIINLALIVFGVYFLF